MSKATYYDGTKLLSLKDLSGTTPEIYMCVTNRTGGKTTFFSRYLVKKFLENGDKFMLLYRYGVDLEGCHGQFFGDIKGLFFPNHDMTSKTGQQNVYSILYLDGKECGYAVSLNAKSDKIKKLSHVFSDTKRMFLDEFQSESNSYVPDELTRLISLHTSVARGQGEQVRFVPVYMCGNPVTLLNPYYTALGIPERLKADTTFLRGDGWVLETSTIESAMQAQKSSGFNRAFKNSTYVSYSSEAKYLFDDTAFLGKPRGISRYMCTLKYDGEYYALRYYKDNGLCYVDKTADETHPLKIACTVQDHDKDTTLPEANPILVASLRDYFRAGSFRFRDLKCKCAAIALLKY